MFLEIDVRFSLSLVAVPLEESKTEQADDLLMDLNEKYMIRNQLRYYYKKNRSFLPCLTCFCSSISKFSIEILQIY